MNKKIGLFFGSFNPVHNGHMIIANFMATRTDLREVWMVVSPQNPLKSKKSLINDRVRLHLVYLAIGKNYHLKPCDIEFNLPKPSYTIDTLIYLKEKYPEKDFVLIMGGDNLATLPKWKNYEIILRDYEVYVYQRPKHDLGSLQTHANVKIFDNAPQMNISSSYIRECIKNDFPIEFLVPPKVEQYILKNYLYR